MKRIVVVNLQHSFLLFQYIIEYILVSDLLCILFNIIDIVKGLRCYVVPGAKVFPDGDN